MGKGRPVDQYQPYNERPDVAIGLLLPFNKAAKARLATGHYASGSNSGGSVFGQSYSTEEQAISNLSNLLLTSKGERIMQPNFGTRIKSVLFENNTIDIRETLIDTITEDIEYWLPYISITDVDIISSTDMHSITIQLHFSVSTIGANLVINILATENEISIIDTTVNTQSPEEILVEVDSFNTNSSDGLGSQY